MADYRRKRAYDVAGREHSLAIRSTDGHLMLSVSRGKRDQKTEAQKRNREHQVEVGGLQGNRDATTTSPIPFVPRDCFPRCDQHVCSREG